jgi:hypothetical protein
MTIDTMTDAVLSDRDLVLQFESLGDSCEFGLVQRRVGAEPLGLFRFAGAPLRHLIRAMTARFESMAEPEYIRVQPENGEYMIKLTKYDFIYHAHVKIGDIDPVALHKQQTRTVRFLVDKLIADLETADKIMVFRQNEDVSANDLLDFRMALAAFGTVRLLWVQPARPGCRAGSVVAVDDTLMVGYVTRLAGRDNAHDFDIESWLTVLRKAHRMHAARTAVRTVTPPLPRRPEPPARIDILFGRSGNAAACLGAGWSGPEDGYNWSIEDRSVMTIAKPPAAQRYCLEMEVVPFIAPPAVIGQRMDVTVNGETVHRFDPLPRGTIECRIPGHLLDTNDRIEIVLEHPDAATPRDAAGQDDDRRLAVSFYRVSLICE